MAYTLQGFKKGDVLKAEHLNHIELGIAALDARLASFYAPIVATLSVEPSEAMAGQTINSAVLTFTTSKSTKTFEIESSQNDVIFATTEDMVGINTRKDSNAYNSTVTWTLKATEKEGNPISEMSATAIATATLTFYHHIYYGVDTVEKGYWQVSANNVSPIKVNARSFSFEVSPENQYIYVFIPEDLCEPSRDPTFIIDKGFAGGFDAKYKEDVIWGNGYGYNTYRVYRSDQRITGKTRVDVS